MPRTRGRSSPSSGSCCRCSNPTACGRSDAMTTAVLQLLVAGIGTGSIYALIALGFNVVFKSTGAMNFAQGEWVVMGGMISAMLLGAVDNVGLACLLAILLVAVLGLISERLVIWPLRRPTSL